MSYQDIKKVHVVYKTHLDIGFTDMGQTVLDCYVNEHIPHSINLALELNTETDKKFIWTVGSFLIDYYLKNASEEAIKKLEEAIQKGYIRWHGIACTTHTELMDKSLFEYSLEMGQKLDKRYGKKTIAAKMTDVPGHTIGIIECLTNVGISYMHIGVNPSSMVPSVPEVFVWKHKGNELIIHYSAEYGQPLFIEGFDEVLEFAHTGDNLGPQSGEQIEEEFKRIKALYPNAKVEASTLDDFAKSLLSIKHKLPIIEEEIGDTWIHGVGSDPLKISAYKELLALKDKWLADGKLEKESKAYDGLMMNLMLIAEHTWGLDFKKYLADFTNWSKEDFQRARKEDATTLEHLSYRNAHMLGVLEQDIINYRKGVFTGSYKHYESAHEEQRMYITRAIEALPENLYKEAKLALEHLVPKEETCEGEKVTLGKVLDINGWRIKFNGNGALYYLEKDGHKWLTKGEVGRLQYEVFDAKNCTDNYYRYNRAFYKTCGWSEGDFSKPGLEFVEDLENTCYEFGIDKIIRSNNQVLVDLTSDTEASEKYGSPRRAQVVYTFEEEHIKCTLKWFDKDANKIPEAIWFKFNFDVENPNRWMLEKLGQQISPLNVVKGGNRKQHCADALQYSGAEGSVEIKSLHAPLVSVGGRNLYEMDNKVNDLENGFYYALFNNRWGTNFKMWCEDDCSFTFEIRVKAHKY